MCALKSGQWANGPRAEEVERLIAARLDVDRCNVVATSSATAALWAACKVLEVECPRVCPLTWPATYTGSDGYPIWVEQHQEADIGVDLWGMPYWGRCSILDASHHFLGPDHVARVSDTPIVYSFAPQKEVSSPDGGVVVFPKLEDATRARYYLSGCVRRRIWCSPGGGNGGVKGLMNEVTAALVREGIRQHDRRRVKRKAVLRQYERHLGDLLVTHPDISSGHLCIVRAPSGVVRDHWRRALTAGKVSWGHHYPMNREQTMQCPEAARTSAEVLTLPCHTRMDTAAVRRVCMRLLTA